MRIFCIALLLLACASRSTAGGAPAPSPPTPPTTTTAPVLRPPATSTPGITSTLTGVFTDSQATAGKEVYVGRCVSCHTGEHGTSAFRRKWAGKMLQDMWGLIRETMPDGDPGTLSDEQYADIVAYLLKLNGMPTGSTPLPADSLVLKKIRLDTLTKQ